jgi:hypothetical protein
VREFPAFTRFRAAAVTFAFLCASVACLCAGGVLAAAQHGVARAILGGGGFAAYVYLFARALDGTGLPRSGAL